MKSSNKIICKSIMKKTFLLIIEIFAILLVTTIIEWYYFGFSNISFRTPISDPGDGFSGIIGIKELLTNGKASFGWPFYTETMKYSARYDLMYRMFIKLIGMATTDYVLIQNIYIFIIPLFNVIICYLVLRNLKFRIWLAYLSSLLFGFCPYVQGRLNGHFALASIECIPLVFLLCLWLYEDNNFGKIGKGWFKYKRNYISLFLTLMIANNGMIYYPFFTCFILIIVGICIFTRNKNIKDVLPTITVIMQIVGWLLIGFIPTIIGIISGVGNVTTDGVGRNAFRATVYGLSIKSLFLSPKGYGLTELYNKYSVLMTISNENVRAYIGIVAIMGLLGLLLILFIDNAKEQILCFRRIKLLSKINVAIILLAVLDGGGVLVAIVFPYISCYNRISPFIVFISILAVGLVIEYCFSKLEKEKVKKNLLLILVLLLFVYSFWEQRACYCYFTAEISAQNQTIMEIDKKFFGELEEKTKPNGMVFQLPYMRSFENGPAYYIPDYDHLKGYLYTNDIRWSYGAVNGSENDVWYYNTSQMLAEDMVNELKEKGFSGIYLNLYGYDEATGNILKNELSIAANCDNMLVSENGMLVYISLDNDTSN